MGVHGEEQCPFHDLGWAQIGGWVAVLGAVLVGALMAGVFLRKTRTKPVGKKKQGGGVVSVGDADGGVRSDGDLDAIIVGAGVAGSALACTLGKVHAYSSLGRLSSR